MAEEKEEMEPAAGKPARGGLVPWVLVGVISAAMGSAVPMFLNKNDPAATDAAAAGSGRKTSTAGSPRVPDPDKEMVYVPFGEPGKDQNIVVNLDEGRMTKYLNLAITLQVAKDDELEFKEILASRKVVLRNWLLSHMSDKNLEEIRGAAGQNRLRREIRERFNTELSEDGYDRVYDVLFEAFNVQ